MKVVSSKPILGGFILALLILGGAGIASYLNIKELTENKRLVEHTYQVLLSIQRIDDGLNDAARGKNRYIITGDVDNLPTYQDGLLKANQALDETAQLTIDKPIQQRNLQALRPVFQRRLATLQKEIALLPQQNLTISSERKALLAQSANLKQEVDKLLEQMVKVERSLLQERSLSTDRSVLINNVFSGIGYLFSFALLLAVYALLQRQIRDRAATEKALSEANQLLETKIQERTAQLAKSTNHLRTIIDAEPDCLKTLDLNGKILEINTSGLGILEADDDLQVIGQDVLPLIEPQYKDAYRQLFQRALLGKAGSIQAEIIAIKGTHRWVESHCVPLYDEQNRIFAVLAISRDITLAKQAEINLRYSEERYRSLVNVKNQIVWHADPNGNAIATNESWQELTGQTFEEVRKWGWVKVVHPDDLEYVKERWSSAIAHKHLYEAEFRAMGKDGNYHYLWTCGIPIFESDGSVREWVGTCTDITDRKLIQSTLENAKNELEIQVRERTRELLVANESLNQAMSKLQSSNEELERFAYVASHDLQEPLRTIASFTQILQRSYHHQLDSDADEYIEFIVDGAKRMQQLITDLLAYSRVGRQELKLRPTDCDRLLKSVIQDLQAAIAASDAQITCEVLPTLLVDSMQISYLWQNLLNNAIKYRGELPPQIHITATPKETEWLFAIGDNGIGIEMEYAERIFEIFQRLHASDEYPGTGLGLAICQKVVERHGGRIWFESKLGCGSTFYFTLPIKSQQSCIEV